MTLLVMRENAVGLENLRRRSERLFKDCRIGAVFARTAWTVMSRFHSQVVAATRRCSRERNWIFEFSSLRETWEGDGEEGRNKRAMVGREREREREIER